MESIHSLNLSTFGPLSDHCNSSLKDVLYILFQGLCILIILQTPQRKVLYQGFSDNSNAKLIHFE